VLGISLFADMIRAIDMAKTVSPAAAMIHQDSDRKTFEAKPLQAALH
jgi:hypothetical protein